MDRFKIERYFTSIGRSFYSGEEYQDLEIDYKPISNFGIGFLSVFMICREIDVKTRYYADEKEGLRLHIPNYDGCFFIEKDDEIDIGTEITLYIDKNISHDITHDQIIKYIKDTMGDVSCDINIKNEIKGEEHIIHSKSVCRQLSDSGLLFIPFAESGHVTELDFNEDILTGSFIDKYPYGLIIDVAGRSKGTVMNSGIKLNGTRASDVWKMLLGGYNDVRLRERDDWCNSFFIFNLPSNYFSIDVSRENITGLTSTVDTKSFTESLLKETAKQILQYMNYAKSVNTPNTAAKTQRLIETVGMLCDILECHTEKEQLLSNRYVPYVKIKNKTIDFIICRKEEKPEGFIACTTDNQAELKNEIVSCINIKKFYKNVVRRLINLEQGSIDVTKNILNDDLAKAKCVLYMLYIVTDAYNYEYITKSTFIMVKKMSSLNDLLLGCSVFDIENGKMNLSVNADDFKRVIDSLKDE